MKTYIADEYGDIATRLRHLEGARSEENTPRKKWGVWFDNGMIGNTPCCGWVQLLGNFWYASEDAALVVLATLDSEYFQTQKMSVREYVDETA